MEMSRRKRRRRRILLIALLLVITGLILLTQLHLSPYIRELARNQAVNAASNAITGSVSEMLRTGNTDFSRVIVLEKDVQGNITALRTDMGQVERMKIEVLGALDGLIDQINTQQMGIPLGNLLLPDLLAGTGPVLPVKAVSLTVSNADFFSDFSEAGINQTLQTLKVKFTISLTILTTVGYESVDVDSDVMVAQTVIVGRVPETYVNLPQQKVGINMEPKQQIEQLTRELEHAGYLYYVLDNPEMSDYDYDHKLRQLEELEAQYPQYASPLSPTPCRRAGAERIRQGTPRRPAGEPAGRVFL